MSATLNFVNSLLTDKPFVAPDDNVTATTGAVSLLEKNGGYTVSLIYRLHSNILVNTVSISIILHQPYIGIESHNSSLSRDVSYFLTVGK